MAGQWSEIVDGTAMGPQNAVMALDGDIRVTALWAESDGVVLHLVADAELDRASVDRLCCTLQRLIKSATPDGKHEN